MFSFQNISKGTQELISKDHAKGENRSSEIVTKKNLREDLLENDFYPLENDNYHKVCFFKN
jgi:hypothetical protein